MFSIWRLEKKGTLPTRATLRSENDRRVGQRECVTEGWTLNTHTISTARSSYTTEQGHTFHIRFIISPALCSSWGEKRERRRQTNGSAWLIQWSNLQMEYISGAESRWLREEDMGIILKRLFPTFTNNNCVRLHFFKLTLQYFLPSLFCR